jgi:DNA-binding CsgD family transcriptional regulator
MQTEDEARHGELVSRLFEAALDSLDMAVFLVDIRLRLLHVNAAAVALAQGDAPLHLQDGRLVQNGSGSLCRIVHAVLQAEPGAHEPQSLCVEQRCGRPLLLTVSRFLPSAGLAWLQPCAIVMARDPATHRLARSMLQQLFGLTSAEAGVAQALAHGEALEDIAAALEISVHTVKAHLKKLFLKTGTRRQAELVALLHDTPALLTPV